MRYSGSKTSSNQGNAPQTRGPKRGGYTVEPKHTSASTRAQQSSSNRDSQDIQELVALFMRRAAYIY
jgi:hypothetical protein